MRLLALPNWSTRSWTAKPPVPGVKPCSRAPQLKRISDKLLASIVDETTCHRWHEKWVLKGMPAAYHLGMYVRKSGKKCRRCAGIIRIVVPPNLAEGGNDRIAWSPNRILAKNGLCYRSR